MQARLLQYGSRRTRTFPLASILVGLALAAPAPPVPAADPAAPVSMTGTLCEVDADARTVAVLTGVGHAFRMTRMQVSPDCLIAIGGQTASLGSLTVGHVARVRYSGGSVSKEAPAPTIAVAIEVLLIDNARGER
jgi:hypothetical protein